MAQHQASYLVHRTPDEDARHLANAVWRRQRPLRHRPVKAVDATGYLVAVLAEQVAPLVRWQVTAQADDGLLGAVADPVLEGEFGEPVESANGVLLAGV